MKSSFTAILVSLGLAQSAQAQSPSLLDLSVFLRDPKLGLETPSVDESAIAASIMKETVENLANRQAANPRDLMRREVHPKSHGCVKADFVVASDLDPLLRQGVFARPGTYKAWIRYSNGLAGGNPDAAPDSRGMAIKVSGVSGPRLDESERATQDFVLLNRPVFFIKDAPEFRDMKISVRENAGNPGPFGSLTPFLLAHPEGLRIAKETLTEQVANPAVLDYFSQTPYRLGTEFSSPAGTPARGLAVKYRVRPIHCATGQALSATPPTEDQKKDPNFLGNALIRSLQQSDICAEFAVQLQRDSASMPIEDATVLWDETVSPFTRVATIRIPRLGNDVLLGSRSPLSTARKEFCESMSFDPWHSLAAHKPLGSLNRVRRVVYLSIANFRRNVNGARGRQIAEPTGLEQF